MGSFRIELKKIAKRYRYEWIFRGVNMTFQSSDSYAIMGHNGSGKSTFLQLLSAYLSPSQGEISFYRDDKKLEIGNVYKHISWTAPYMELIEEYNLVEMLRFHQRFCPFVDGLTIKDILQRVQLPRTAIKKTIRYFSSGMKQRLKLALTILSDTDVLLLDEPTITLDQAGMEWYQQLMRDYAFDRERLVVVASNVEDDFMTCRQRINILDYKK